MKRIVFSFAAGAAVVVLLLGLLSKPKATLSTNRIAGVMTASVPAVVPGGKVMPLAKLADPAAMIAAVRREMAKTEQDEARAAFTNFANWAESYLANPGSVSLMQGEALAWKRREAMLGLIQTDPAKAIDSVAAFKWRTELPSNITRYVEQWVDGRGDLTVLVGTDFERQRVTTSREVAVNGQTYQAYVFGRRTGQVSQNNLPIHGVTLDGKMALDVSPIRILEPAEATVLTEARGQVEEVICGVSGLDAGYRNQEVAADIGGEVKHFCGVDHSRAVKKLMLLAESGGNNGGFGSLASAGNDAWTHGPKNVLYMRVNFPDDLTEPISEAQAYDIMDEVNLFYTEGSYDVTALLPTVTPLMTLPQTKGWYSTAGPGSLINDARELARRAGFETGNYPLDIVTFTTVPGYDFGGLAAVHGKSVWLQSPGAGVTAHELGHNYGLLHANFWITTNNSVIGVGTNVEYGNIFDTMGNATAGNNQFNAAHKNILDWLPDPSVHNVASNGVYRIYPFDASLRKDGRFYAAKVTKDYGREYWLEYHERFNGNPWMRNGILLHWAPWEQSNGGTHMLDTTPDTVSRDDSALVVGRTFSDVEAGVHITTLRRGTTGTDPWMEVQVNLGDSPGNWPPYLSVEYDPTNAAPGALVHLHATAVDINGDALAYAWSFDDGSFSTNNLPWVSKTWAAAGEHVVRCVVSDMKGGIASANTVVPVGTPSGFRVSGTVLDANDDPVEGVRIDNGNTTGGGYVSCFTDSDGNFVITGLGGGLNLEANKYGYTFTNLNWQNTLTVDANLTRIDFLATANPTVHFTTTTNTIAETNSATQFITLTRTGNLSNDLPVTVYLSGTADIGTDYTLTPPLVQDLTNLVIIPAGTQSVTFAYQILNDSMGEAAETFALTVVDDASYIVTASGTAKITILDDDALATLPAITVAAVTPTIPENGMDRGTFLFTRTGSTKNDLTVFYTAGGTATPGVDYSTLVGLVVIPAGSETATVSFQTFDDKLLEPDETVSVTVSANVAYSGTGAGATVTITDDDLLTVSIYPTDGDAAEPATPGRYTVKRDGELTGNLVVYYTVGGSATSGTDFVPLSGAVVIPANRTSADIVLTPKDDSALEGDESVIVTLATNVAYNVGNPGVATIFIRDKEKVTVSIVATNIGASEPGLDFGTFEISRGTVVNGNLTVNLAISGTAISGSDYVPLPNSVVIPDGASSVSLDVIPFDDLHSEPSEDVQVVVLPSTNYNVEPPALARVYISDDDSAVPAVGFTFSTTRATENQSPGISVSLSATSSSPITVEYLIIGGTASSNDYTLTPGPLTFDPGQRAKSIPLSINNDTAVEPDETIRLALFNPVGATLDGIKIHTYTIVDDDMSAVSVAATGANASETGTAGNFRISRNGAISNALQVTFEITGTASAPADYASLGTSVMIPAGAASVDLPVIPVEDQTLERTETIRLTLLTAAGAKIASPNAATITIGDDDQEGLPSVVVTSTNQPYAVEGGGSGAFVFTRTGATTEALTLSVTVGGTAASVTDYAAVPTSVTIPIGQASVTIPVAAVDDALIEGEETVIVALTVTNTYRVSFPSSATVTIQDNDQIAWLDASDFDAAEPGTNPGQYTFSRFGTTNTPLQVFFTITGSAINGVDYMALSNSFVIPAGSLTATLPIIPLDDPLIEGPETVTLTLQSSPGYALGQPVAGTVIIKDDEPTLTIVVSRTNILEGSYPPAFLTVQRGGNPEYEFMAKLAIGGTASYGVDYPPFLTNVFFTCGVTSINLTISPTNELMKEADETVTAVILPDAAYRILSPSNAALTILDAATNLAPTVTITSPTSSPVYLLGTNVNIILESRVVDDGDTNTPIVLTWTNLSGLDKVVFGKTDQTNTTVGFTNSGVYVLRLTADDGQVSSFAEVTVVVDAQARLATNILHWTFDEGSGTNVVDVSSNGNNGVIVGAAGWTTNGAIGGALNLNGTNNFVRTLGTAALLDGLKQFSLSLWVKPADTNVAGGIFTANTNGATPTWTLSRRSFAACGSSTNLIETTFATTRTEAKHASASNLTTNGWQHIALTWSNGLAPALYINGQLDKPQQEFVTLYGFITNCPQFLIGRGAADILDSFRGAVDDVRVFPRRLGGAEVGGFVTTNLGPLVEVATNIVVQILTPVELSGVVTDDNRPAPPGVVSNTWLQFSGPQTITITNQNDLTNTVQFTQAGDYVFRLISDDGQVKVFRDLPVTVVEPTMISVSASDSDAAELGPDPGEFTFQRNGDLALEFRIYVAVSGTASNGADVVFFPETNTIVFPPDIDTVKIPVTPFLDDRIEGDETLIFTVLSNVSYSISSATATITIHDSPYGVWSVAHFTLEELTDPSLSGMGADFDHDRRVNFAEYAANLDPKVPDTNAPMVTAIEVTPDDNQKHITLTYHRRLAPTDTAYEVYVSRDLTLWNSGTNQVLNLSTNDDGNTFTETIRARLVAPYTTTNNTFIRLGVWLMTTGP